MATKNQWNQEDEEESKQTSLQSGVLGGTGGTSAPGTAARQTAWTNLQTYLDTNKGSGTAIADEVLKGTKQEVGAARDAAGAWADAASKRVQDKTLKDEWSGQIKTGSVDDLNKMDKNAFSAWKQLGTYWGASDATADEGYGQTSGAVRNAQGKVDVANTWQGQQQLARDTYGKSGRYSSGMGALDAFVARGDAQNKFDEFKTQNENLGDSLTSATGRVNSAIGQAKTTGAQNYKNVMDAISGRIGSIQSEADKRAGEVAEREYQDLYNNVSERFRPYGETPSSINAYVTPNKLNTSDLLSQAEVDALNTLGGLDDDLGTGNYSRTQGRAYTLDQAKLDADINAARDAALQRRSPTVSVEQVSAQQSGTGSEGQKITTTYPDGSYDVQGPAGEIIHYNADGTIKGTSGTNIFTLK